MVQPYVFMTDSDSDLPFSIADERNIPVVKMPYILEGQEYFDDNGRAGVEKDFFAKMRAGAAPSTSLLSTPVYVDYFEPIFQEGKDILFIAFSSKMSNTILNIFEARDELLKKYPERKMIVVDTMSISAPMTLLVLKAHDMYQAGATMEEIEAWVLENRFRAQVWMTVDDLKYLRRGGRISATSAVFGSMLSIKPILTMGKGGKIDAVEKVQGSKKAMKIIAERVAENIENAGEQTLVLLHADVEEEAQKLADIVKARIPEIKEIRLQIIGPVIGAHCGPGTLAVCFMGRERVV